jgi:phosphoglycolate phosphatase-like HAD superfamily hydrolase
MDKFIIKNIMWDVDGVLANLDHAYHRFLTEHPSYKEQYKNLKFENLAEALPIAPRFGTLELTSHPTMGEAFNHDFCYHSGEIYFDRPLYPNVKDVLKALHNEGYFQMTMSAGFDKKVKEKMIADCLGDDLSFVKIEVVEHAKATEGQSKAMIGEKEARILECLEKYNLKAEETILVDDRIFNCETGLKLGMHVMRARWAISLDTPPPLRFNECKTIIDFKAWLQAFSTQG